MTTEAPPKAKRKKVDPAPQPVRNRAELEEDMTKQWADMQQKQRAHRTAAQAVADAERRINLLSDQLAAAQESLATARAAELETRVELRRATSDMNATATEYGSSLE